MGYRIQSGKALKKEIRRIFHEQRDGAVEELAGYPEKNAEGLHASRKHIKRMRAMIRLLREVKDFRRPAKAVNQCLRETARSLSANRDREVLIGLLDSWAASNPAVEKPLLGKACEKLKDRLLKEGHIPKEIPPATREKVQAALAQAESLLADSLSGKLTRAALVEAAGKQEKKWERAYRDYVRNPGNETLHNWRKRLKDHYYLRKLLHEVSGLKKKRTREIKTLESLLSEARDCDLLLETLMSRIDLRLDVNEVAALVQHTESLRSQYLHEAGKRAG